MAKKWLNKNVAAMGVTSLLSDTSHEMATATLPAFLTQLVGSSSPQLLGLITGLSDALSSFVKIFSGWLSDKLKKRKPLVVLGYALTGIFVGLIGFAKNWLEILFYRSLAWFGRGMREPPRDALLVESTDKRFYGHAFGFHRAMDTLGAIIGPLLALILVPLIGLRNTFFFSLIPGLLAVLAILIFVKEKEKNKRKVQSLFKHIKSLPKEFQLFTLIMFVFGIANFNKTLLLLRVQESLTPTQGLIFASSLAIIFYTIRNIAQALADYVVGSLSDKFGKRNLLAIFGFFLFGLMSLGFMISSTNVFYFLFLFILSGISAAAYTALEKAYAADLLPENMRGTGYGVLQTVDGIGDFVSSFVVGTLWVAFSFSIAFFYSSLLSFVSAILLLTLIKNR